MIRYGLLLLFAVSSWAMDGQRRELFTYYKSEILAKTEESIKQKPENAQALKDQSSALIHEMAIFMNGAAASSSLPNMQSLKRSLESAVKEADGDAAKKKTYQEKLDVLTKINGSGELDLPFCKAHNPFVR